MLLQNHYAEIPLGQLSAFSDKMGELVFNKRSAGNA